MALDVDKNRLFTGCRGPQKLIVMSSKDGRVSSHMAIGESVDAVQFDHGRAFASTPLATVFVAGETSPGNYMYASA